MKVTFIFPAIGKKRGQKYIRTWKMEPLPIATLAALTPPDIEVEFFDDRLELIDYDTTTDLVALSVETYTARRAYKIAAKFRERGIPVVMGGYHPTAVPNEAIQYADSVIVGNAEKVWKTVIADAKAGKLQPKYLGEAGYSNILPDRTIFNNHKYLNMGLVETGRGCNFSCEFCHISTYYDATYYPRPIENVVADIKNSGKKYFFFVDDNLVADVDYAKQLCTELKKLDIFWAAQGSLTMARDETLLTTLYDAGCRVMLIGFESLDEANLAQMNKGWNRNLGEVNDLVEKIHNSGLSIYATFLVGYDNDTPETINQALEFSQKHSFFYAAFNHLLPFPATPLYDRLVADGRMVQPKWWLEDDYLYGDIPFRPKQMTQQELSDCCAAARREFFSLSSIAKRFFVLPSRKPPPSLLPIYLLSNMDLRGEVNGKLGLPVGDGLDELPK